MQARIRAFAASRIDARGSGRRVCGLALALALGGVGICYTRVQRHRRKRRGRRGVGGRRVSERRGEKKMGEGVLKIKNCRTFFRH